MHWCIYEWRRVFPLLVWEILMVLNHIPYTNSPIYTCCSEVPLVAAVR